MSPPRNFVLADPPEPAYLALHRSGELADRAARAVAGLASCKVCPRDCEVDRLADESAVCRLGRHAMVSSAFPHHGEEDCLRGWRGSGTVFFSMCNLRCVFCQNHEISQLKTGRELDANALADVFLRLQDAGCHNLNWVTPEHVVPQALEALDLAAGRGLRLPLVYNTSAYDSMASLAHLDGVVDIYMPDFKMWDEELGFRYLKVRDYAAVARRVVREMHRQVGDLVFDSDGLARRGLLVRHLVMPGDVAGTREVMRWLVDEISPDVYVNVMDQYHPDARVGDGKYAEIDRRITAAEMDAALAAAREVGVYRIDTRGALPV